MTSAKASVAEIDEGAQRALARAIADMSNVDPASTVGLLDQYLDAAVSERATPSEVDAKAEAVLSRNVSNFADVDAQSLAGVIDTIRTSNDLSKLDAAANTNTQAELRDPVTTHTGTLDAEPSSIASKMDATISSRATPTDTGVNWMETSIEQIPETNTTQTFDPTGDTPPQGTRTLISGDGLFIEPRNAFSADVVISPNNNFLHYDSITLRLDIGPYPPLTGWRSTSVGADSLSSSQSVTLSLSGYTPHLFRWFYDFKLNVLVSVDGENNTCTSADIEFKPSGGSPVVIP